MREKHTGHLVGRREPVFRASDSIGSHGEKINTLHSFAGLRHSCQMNLNAKLLKAFGFRLVSPGNGRRRLPQPCGPSCRGQLQSQRATINIYQYQMQYPFSVDQAMLRLLGQVLTSRFWQPSSTLWATGIHSTRISSEQHKHTLIRATPAAKRPSQVAILLPQTRGAPDCISDFQLCGNERLPSHCHLRGRSHGPTTNAAPPLLRRRPLPGTATHATLEARPSSQVTRLKVTQSSTSSRPSTPKLPRR